MALYNILKRYPCFTIVVSCGGHDPIAPSEVAGFIILPHFLTELDLSPFYPQAPHQSMLHSAVCHLGAGSGRDENCAAGVLFSAAKDVFLSLPKRFCAYSTQDIPYLAFQYQDGPTISIISTSPRSVQLIPGNLRPTFRPSVRPATRPDSAVAGHGICRISVVEQRLG